MSTAVPAARSPAGPPPPRRTARAELAAAIDLGWRVAALHALEPAALTPLAPGGNLLLNRASLPAAERIELELRAIAGAAARARAPLRDGALERLLELVPAAAGGGDGLAELRRALEAEHRELALALWSDEEARGRAYELGNFVSDTWQRIVRAGGAPRAELRAVFGAERVQRMKVLLDDLQARLDPTAVHVVEQHLDSWRDRVAALPAGDGDPDAGLGRDALAARYEPVRRQAIIWRQLLTGDKEPEAFIGRARRAQVRDELSRQLWRRYRRYWPALPAAALLGAAIAYLFARDSGAGAAVAGFVGAAGGMLGITRASLLATVRQNLQSWGELMWNRSLAVVICRETLVVDELLGPPPSAGRRPSRGGGEAARGAGD